MSADLAELLTPTSIAPAESESSDPRLDGLLKQHPDDATRVVIVGFPCDEGVARNGGRPGAARAPDEIRRALYRSTPDARNPGPSRALFECTADLGDVRIVGELVEDQQRLARVVSAQLERDRIVVVLGGGHETAFGHALGHFEAGLETRILNWDAHPDVRPLISGLPHSGSPFRQALEHASGLCRGYTVAGLEPWCVAIEHLAWLEGQRGSVVWRDQIDGAKVDQLFASLPTLVTFDLDALPANVAPGVSAPAARGLELELWLRAARCAGETASVRSIDVVELNPQYDVDSRTARVAALTIWQFLAGLNVRLGYSI